MYWSNPQRHQYTSFTTNGVDSRVTRAPTASQGVFDVFRDIGSHRYTFQPWDAIDLIQIYNNHLFFRSLMIIPWKILPRKFRVTLELDREICMLRALYILRIRLFSPSALIRIKSRISDVWECCYCCLCPRLSDIHYLYSCLQSDQYRIRECSCLVQQLECIASDAMCWCICRSP
jgi:hypothetical protein